MLRVQRSVRAFGARVAVRQYYKPERVVLGVGGVSSGRADPFGVRWLCALQARTPRPRPRRPPKP